MSLLFPLYLVGLLGLALPWLLHRFSDHQPDEQVFPSKRFLEPTAPPVSRTRRFKYPFLLLLRVLSLLLLCVLFAQPWLERQFADGRAKAHHVIGVDRSFSMRADGRWESAMAQARRIVSQIPDADTIELVAFDTSLERLADDSESLAAINNALADLQPGFLAAEYGVLMQRFGKLAAEQDRPVTLWLVTDQQKSALPAQLNALYTPELASFELISVVEQVQHNIHLKATARSVDGVNLTLMATLSSSATVLAAPESEASAEAATPQYTIRVLHEESVLAAQPLGLKAGEVKSLVFDDLVMPPGDEPVLTVRVLADDALTEDNQLALKIQQANPSSVTYLQTDRTTSGNARVFVSTAMQTDARASVDTQSGGAERLQAGTTHLITARDLSMSDQALDVLQFVDGRSNAVVFDSRLPPVQSDATVKGVETGWVDESHPLNLGDIDWYGIRFYELAPMALKEDDRVLIETTDRQAILVERPTTRGRLLLLNDRLDGQSSNLPLQPAFVDLMQSILTYFDTSNTLPVQLRVGERVLLPGNTQLFNPRGDALLSLQDSGRAGGVQLLEPGMYSIIDSRGEHALQVITDEKEADLSLIGDEAMQSWQKRYLDTDKADSQGTIADTSSAPARKAKPADANGLTLWQVLLPMLAAFLLLESVSANRRLDVRRDGS